MKNILFFLMVFVSTVGMAQEGKLRCWGVRGKDQEAQAFRDENFSFYQGNPEIAGYQCDLFASWKKLGDHFKLLKKSLKLNKLDRFLLVNATHGNPDGSFRSLDGEESAKSILTVLKLIAQEHQVGASMTACYSAELMRLKLLADRLRPEDSTIDRLCLATSSLFGQMTMARTSGLLGTLGEISSGFNFEQFFSKTTGNLISSAAWEESGLVDQMEEMEINQYESLLNKLASISKFSSAKDYSWAKSSVEAALHPTFSGPQMLKTSFVFSDFSIYPQKIDFKRLISLLDKKSLNDKTAKEMVSVLKTTSQSSTALTWGQVAIKIIESCNYNGRDLYDARIELEDIAGDWSELKGFFFSMINACSINLAKTKNEIGQSWPMIKDIFLGKAYPGTNYNSEIKLNILSSILQGDEVPFEKRAYMDDVGGNFGTGISSNQIINGFIRGSIRKPTFDRKLDERRRGACRNFKI